MIISRPLTYISDEDDLESLTSELFLQEVNDSTVPDIDLIEETRWEKNMLIGKKLIKISENGKKKYYLC